MIEVKSEDVELCTVEKLSEIRQNMQHQRNSARVSLIPWCGYNGHGFDLKDYVLAKGIAQMKQGMS